MPSVAVNGATLEYVEAGRGEPVLFVHGSLDDLRSWRSQLEPFAARYRTVAYSRRYHFPNPWPTDGAPRGTDYSAELHADDLAAVIQALDLAPVHLVTSSYGGNVALYMVQRHPALVRSLVLGEPPLLPWLDGIPGGPAQRQRFLDEAWLPAQEAFAAGRLEDGARLFLDGVMGRPTLEHLGRRAYRMIMDNAPEMAAETQASRYFPPFTCAHAREITQPALLCRGELSPPLFGLITEALVACLPRAQGPITIPGASHAMHVGNPQAYNAAVLGFLGTVE